MAIDKTSPAYRTLKTRRFRERYLTLQREIKAFQVEIGAKPRSIFRIVQDIDNRDAKQARWDACEAAIRDSIYPDV